MKIKIVIVYLLAFLVLFLTSCSEIIDTNAKEFAGAKFGAGKGVSWTNYYRNEN